MESLHCHNCDKPITETDNFCPKCGAGLKCKECKKLIKTGDQFCSNCGEPVSSNKSTENAPLNTIKYKKSETEVSCEISFTDDVGKESMNDLLAAIVGNRNNISGEGYHNNDVARLVDKSATFEINEHAKAQVNDHLQNIGIDEFPHLNDIEHWLECSENVWIGIHAFYLSEHGAKNFNKETVRTAYMVRRKTESRVNNFAAEWRKAHQKFFKTINDNELGFQLSGLEDIKNVIAGNKIQAKAKGKKSNAAANTKKTLGKSVPIEEFDLGKDDIAKRPSLEDFLATKKPGDNTYDRIVVIAYYITRLVKADYFTEGQIEFAYKALQLSDRPGHLRQTINNIKNSKVWFKDFSQGQWSLERIGEIYVEQKLPVKEAREN
jgi:RNA polymerase subunit RPABC4/transcription elongation factor Spt4